MTNVCSVILQHAALPQAEGRCCSLYSVGVEAKEKGGRVIKVITQVWVE